VKRVYLIFLLLVGLLLISSSQAHFSSGVQLSKYDWTENDRGAVENLHKVQLSIERYAIDHDGEYPLNLQALMTLYISEWPKNPYSKGNPGIFLRMHQVEIGNFMPGGIIYYPYEYPGYEGMSSYYLAVYGATLDSGRNVSLKIGSTTVNLGEVLIVLSSRPEPRGVF